MSEKSDTEEHLCRTDKETFQLGVEIGKSLAGGETVSYTHLTLPTKA
jgi:hypothetical protein